MQTERKLHVYTGDGKGKTTAAMGLALRSIGHGQRVFITQFLKRGDSGELLALAKLPGVKLQLEGSVEGFVSQMTPEERARTADRTEETARALARCITLEKPDLVILDELCVALHLGMLSQDGAHQLLDSALSVAETVVTGRDAPQWLVDEADYVSVIGAVKHPFASVGLPAREGIEY